MAGGALHLGLLVLILVAAVVAGWHRIHGFGCGVFGLFGVGVRDAGTRWTYGGTGWTRQRRHWQGRTSGWHRVAGSGGGGQGAVVWTAGWTRRRRHWQGRTSGGGTG